MVSPSCWRNSAVSGEACGSCQDRRGGFRLLVVGKLGFLFAAPREFGVTDVAQYRQQPGFHRRPSIAVEMAQRAQIAFLHRVFGIGRVAHEIARQRVDVVQMGQRGVAKTPRSVMLVIGITCHGTVLGHPRRRRRLLLQPGQHHWVVLLPVAASTTIVPVMCG